MLFKRLSPEVKLPYKGTPFAAAFDIFMPTSGCITHHPKLFKLGFAVAIPQGYVGILAPRSSTGTKDGLCLTNTIGVIDSDYRGEVGVLIINLSQDVFTIEPGVRIAQMVVAKYEVTGWNVVESLDETDRGAGGYGSSGSK